MMLLFKFQRADSSFTNFNGDFIKGFALCLSGDPAVREINTSKLKMREIKSVQPKWCFDQLQSCWKRVMISCCDQSKAECNVCPVKRYIKVLIIKRVITKKIRCFNLDDFDQSLKFRWDSSGSYICTHLFIWLMIEIKKCVSCRVTTYLDWAVLLGFKSLMLKISIKSIGVANTNKLTLPTPRPVNWINKTNAVASTPKAKYRQIW